MQNALPEGSGRASWLMILALPVLNGDTHVQIALKGDTARRGDDVENRSRHVPEIMPGLGTAVKTGGAACGPSCSRRYTCPWSLGHERGALDFLRAHSERI